MKQFRIKPLLNLAKKTLLREVEIKVPVGGKVRVQQYENFVWLMIESIEDFENSVERKIIIVTEGEKIPHDYEFIGNVIGNLLGDSPLYDDDGKEIEEGEEDEEDGTTVSLLPHSDDDFYQAFFPLCAYISAEKPSRLNSKSWSYLGEKS